MTELVEKMRSDPKVTEALILAPTSKKSEIGGNCMMHKHLAKLEGQIHWSLDQFKNYATVVTKIVLLDPKMETLPDDFFVQLPNLRYLDITAGKEISDVGQCYSSFDKLINIVLP